MDPLFAVLPEDLKALSDEDLQKLMDEHLEAAKLIDADDQEFLAGLSGEAIIEQYRQGAEQIKALRAEQAERLEAHENFVNARAEISAEITPKAETSDDDEGDGGDEGDEGAEAQASVPPSDEVVAEEEKSDPVEEKVLVTASGEAETTEEEPESKPEVRLARKPPAPAPERIQVTEEKQMAFVASGLLPSTPPGQELKDADQVAKAVQSMAKALGPASHHAGGREDKYLVASLDYGDNFPEERRLHASDWQANAEKIEAIGSPYFAKKGLDALVASGGLCAPLEPIYTMPQLATAARPVRDALPNFRAERGGVNVPTPTTIGDVANAITVITEANDALGGTFATKACLDMDCPDYTETAVTIISHCREFGNLNAMAWPEKIRHENALTMAGHSRAADSYLLDRLDALSLSVTQAAVYGSASSLLYAHQVARAGIISRLRMDPGTRFRSIMPFWAAEMFSADIVNSQFDRFGTTPDAVAALFARYGIDVSWHLDEDADGTTNEVWNDEVTGTGLNTWPGGPAVVSRFFPEGTFLHIDMAELNLGIVRDSTLNSTNDFQIFGETFENVARIGPAQAALRIVISGCPDGRVAAPETSEITCDSDGVIA